MGVRAALIIVAACAAGTVALAAPRDHAPAPRDDAATPRAPRPARPDDRAASPRAHRAPARVRASRLVDRAPFLGVACRRPNSTRCDRVGLAVWVRRPLDRLRARVAGRRLELAYVGTGGGARMFVGYLRPAGLRSGPLRVPPRWEGRRRPSARIRLWADKVGGQTVTTAVRVPLHAGFG